MTTNQTNIMELNLDCQLMILEQMPLTTLISMAETNRYFMNLVTDIFGRKFGKHRVQFQAPFVDFPVFYNQTEGPIKLKDSKTVSKVLSHFGQSIHSLKAKYLTSDMPVQTKINQLINAKCSDTLKQFDIISYKNHFFDDFSKPFKAIESVSVRGIFSSFSREASGFGTLFPNMRHLKIQLAKGQNMSWFDYEFKQLEHLNADFCYYDAPRCYNEDIMIKFFDKNPQIRTLNISYFTRDLLKHAAKQLSNLENLQIEFYEDRNDYDESTEVGDDHDEIHFEHLKSFTMKSGGDSMPKSVRFEKLVEFRTDANPKDCLRWLKFVESNQNLKKLVIFGRYLKKEEISRLTAAKLGLVEATIKCKKNVDYETIAEFIENSTKLRKLVLKFDEKSIPHESFGAIMKSLRKNLSVKWTINEVLNKREIILEWLDLSVSQPMDNHFGSR